LNQAICRYLMKDGAYRAFNETVVNILVATGTHFSQ
jgi:hypothetical protein